MKDNLKVIFEHFTKSNSDKIDIHEILMKMEEAEAQDQNILVSIFLRRIIEKNQRDIPDHLYDFESFARELEEQLEKPEPKKLDLEHESYRVETFLELVSKSVANVGRQIESVKQEAES